MRYVAYTAAVFGAASILVTSSHALHNSASIFNNIATTPVVTLAAPVGVASDISKPLILAAKPTVTSSLPTTQTPIATTADATVTVAPDDNLANLAKAAGTTYQRLYDANPTVNDPNLIYPGQVLTIPAADETLSDRPLPRAPAAETSLLVPNPSTVAPTTKPVTAAAQTTVPAVADGSVWDKLAACESGGNWSINTGNGFYGGLQFTLSSWRAVGGTGYPSDASRDEQIMRGQMLQARGGWGNWPACSAKLGL